MNWLLFGLLWGAAFFLKFLAEQPDTLTERVLIAVVYTIGCFIVAVVVPPEHTVMGLVVVCVPLAADGIVKLYRGRELNKIYGTLTK